MSPPLGVGVRAGHCSDFYHHGPVLPVLELHINGTTQDALLSLAHFVQPNASEVPPCWSRSSPPSSFYSRVAFHCVHLALVLCKGPLT